MAAGSQAYWVDPRGQIIGLREPRHINTIIDNPEKFGLTKGYIKTVYEKHGEILGTEGDAREELIGEVLKKGFIRIRLYPNRYWSVTIERLGRNERRTLETWAKEAAKVRFAGPYMDVRVVELGRGKTTRTSIDEIQSGSLVEGVDYWYAVYPQNKHFPRFITEAESFGL